jgi:hypothetical protein
MFRSEQGDERSLDAADTSIRPTVFVSLYRRIAGTVPFYVHQERQPDTIGLNGK